MEGETWKDNGICSEVERRDIVYMTTNLIISLG